jgi:hypothetical protein
MAENHRKKGKQKRAQREKSITGSLFHRTEQTNGTTQKFSLSRHLIFAAREAEKMAKIFTGFCTSVISRTNH